MSADRLRALADEDLGSAIRASEPAWPVSPPLASIVAERIGETERLPQLRPRLSLPSRRRTVLILVAATRLRGAAAVAARLVVRIGAETVTVVPGPPTSLPSDTISPQVLGEPATSVSAAATVAGFESAVPERLGAPDAIWTGAGVPGVNEASARIVLAWRPTPALPQIEGLPWGAVLIEFRGDAELAGKTVYEEGGELRSIIIDGRDGISITGTHSITLASLGGGEPVSLRVTGDVLLWQRGDLTMRLETALGVPAALEVARSTR
jgi:hypothetical protein